MKIQSDDKNYVVELKRGDVSDPYSGYSIKFEVRTNESFFSGQNECVHLVDLEKFLFDFDKLFKTRKGVATLDLTEDCSLHFFLWNNKGDLACRATVSKYLFINDPLKTISTSLTSEFKLNSEFLNSLKSEFESL